MATNELGAVAESAPASLVQQILERLAETERRLEVAERRLEVAERRLAAAESSSNGGSAVTIADAQSTFSDGVDGEHDCARKSAAAGNGCRKWTRRGLLLGAAVGAGVVATAPPAAAGTGVMQYGATNNAGPDDTTLASSSSGRTMLVSNSGFGSALQASAVENHGLVATSSSEDGILAYSGSKSAIRLVCGAASGPPTSGVHNRGSLLAPLDGSLWWCAATGVPGAWRMIMPPATRAAAGPFVPVTPMRVYDSRRPQPGPAGRIPAGTHRTIAIAHGRDLTTGAIVTYDLVPPGAQAVALNLTAVRPAGSGFLALAPGGATSYSASALNYTAGVTLANGLTAAINPGSRQLEVFVATAATDVLIDILGYY